MDYSTFSTSALTKILGRAAGDSAEHGAIQRELARREEDLPRPDKKRIPLLFTASEWERVRRVTD
jgi:hypothetical protein